MIVSSYTVDLGTFRFLRITTWSSVALGPSRQLHSDFQSLFSLLSHNSPTWSVGTCKVTFLKQGWRHTPAMTATGILFQAYLTPAFCRQEPCSFAVPVQPLELGGLVLKSKTSLTYQICDPGQVFLTFQGFIFFHQINRNNKIIPQWVISKIKWNSCC